MNRVCKQCGEPVPDQPNGGRPRKFCSDECQRLWWKENRETDGKVYRFTCQNCGKEYETLYSNRNTCCSRECGWELASKRSLVEKLCVSCGATFKGRANDDYCSDGCKARGMMLTCRVCGQTFRGHGNSAYCSRECSLEIGRRKYEQYMTRRVGQRVYTCRECGQVFNAPYGTKRRRFCSPTCSVNWQHKHNHRIRRARKYCNGPVDFIEPLMVFDRDGWACGICGRKVNPRLSYPHPMSASLDHIQSLARGGTHTWDNVQCSHLRCNVRKGAKPSGQMRLAIEDGGGPSKSRRRTHSVDARVISLARPQVKPRGGDR